MTRDQPGKAGTSALALAWRPRLLSSASLRSPVFTVGPGQGKASGAGALDREPGFTPFLLQESLLPAPQLSAPGQLPSLQ